MHQTRISRILIILLPLIAIALSACATELQPQMSHQGRLLDGSGNPVADGNYDVEYVLFNAATGGTGVYTETQTIAVEDGLFTTSLGLTGFITPTIFAQPTWLQISIDGETLTPRQRLQGAPYAFSLTSGAVIQGLEAITDTPGATLAILNRAGGEQGGSGLGVQNNAAAAGAARDDVAALAVSANGGSVEPSAADDRGSYGAVIESQGYRGMLVVGGELPDGSDGYLAAVFDSPVGILVQGGGGCSGCTLAYIARNTGDLPIRKGDFVAIDSVELDADFNVPVMQVRRATSSDIAVIGVATGALSREAASETLGVPTGGYDRAGVTANKGDFVNVAVQGLVQARAAAGATLQPGAAVSVDANGVIAASGAGLARAMSAVDANGLVWVMVGGPAGGQ